MHLQTALNFLTKILEQYRLNIHVVWESETHFEQIDKGIRQYLGLHDLYKIASDLVKSQLSSNIIYVISDDFFSSYLAMALPNEKESCFLVIGPYTTQNLTQTSLLSFINQYPLPNNVINSLLQYYASIPFIADISPIRTLLGAFYETVWETSDNYTFSEINHKLAESFIPTPSHVSKVNTSDIVELDFQKKLVEERYQLESSIIQYVSHGNYDKILALLTGINDALMEQRANTPLRDFKNYGIVLNTLLRKGAEAGLVHPIHIDKLSSYYARKIESLTSFEQGKGLMTEMIRKYCFLVKNHSLKDYSLLVQKVVTRIDTDLTADQSLKKHASLLNVHPSYLSALFHKETGVTLTEYVNQKRIEHSVFLLNTTNMQIQMVAQHCGIPDINYFTRIFKKQIGKTPSEYKKSLQK